MNPIARFRRELDLTWAQTADVLGMTVAYTKKLAGDYGFWPSPELAMDIEKRTKGRIRAEELIFHGRSRKRPEGAA